MTGTAPRFPQGPVLDANGYISLEWQQWLQNPDFVTLTLENPLAVESGGTGQATALPALLEMAGPFYPANPDATPQVDTAIYGGFGVPSNASGANGDFYFRSDGTVGSNIYKKAAGLWAAIL